MKGKRTLATEKGEGKELFACLRWKMFEHMAVQMERLG